MAIESLRDVARAGVSAFSAGGGSFTESGTAPGSPSYGDRWLDTSSGIQYTWVDPGVWVDLSEPTSADIAAAIHSATSKTTPVDADELGYLDSTSSFGLVRMTWANLKTWLGGLFVSKTGDTMTGALIVERESGVECELGVRSYSGGPPVLHGYYANGTKLTPTAVTGGQMILGIGSRGWDGVDFAEHSTAAIHMVSTENHSATAQGTDFRILVTPVGKTHADRKTAVSYYAPATGLRVLMRLHGTDNERTWFQTDEAGQNSSLTVVPNGSALSANLQARTSDTENFRRAYLSASEAEGVRLVSDAGGSESAQNLIVAVGGTDCVTHHVAGTVTHHSGTKLGADAPIIRVKKLTGTTAATEGATVSVAHGLTSSQIRGVQIVVRTAALPDEAIPPGFTTNAGRQYEAYTGAANLAVINHATNSENILSSAFTALITYEPTA